MPAVHACLLWLPLAAAAQDPAPDPRSDLMAAIRNRLARAHSEILRGVESIFIPPSAEAENLRKRLAEVRAEQRRIEVRLIELRWVQKDADLLRRIQSEGMSGRRGSELFRDAIGAHNDGDYEVSIPIFKKIYYGLAYAQDEQVRTIATLAAYNAACGYSLSSRGDDACDWLEMCLGRGYLQMQDSCHDSKRAHLEADADFANVRGLERFQALLRRYASTPD